MKIKEDDTGSIESEAVQKALVSHHSLLRVYAFIFAMGYVWGSFCQIKTHLLHVQEIRPSSRASLD